MPKTLIVLTLVFSFSAMAEMTVKQVMMKKDKKSKPAQVQVNRPLSQLEDRPTLRKGGKASINLGTYPL